VLREGNAKGGRLHRSSQSKVWIHEMQFRIVNIAQRESIGVQEQCLHARQSALLSANRERRRVQIR
jgi:hypothetical protein